MTRTRPRTVTRPLRLLAVRGRSQIAETEAGAEIALPLAEIETRPSPDRHGWHDVDMPDWLARDRGLK